MDIEQNNQEKKTNMILSNYDVKSILGILSAKPDIEFKVFNKPKIIYKNDIILLNERINNKLRTENIISENVSVHIIFKKGKMISLNRWEEFLNTDLAIPDITESITINWDLMIKLHNYQLPQRHNLKIRIGTDIRPNEFYQLLDKNVDDIELNESLSFIVCKVDFVNDVIANELIYQVEEWYNTLSNLPKKSTFQKIVIKYPFLMARFSHILVDIIGLLLLYSFFNMNLRNYAFKFVNNELIAYLVSWIIILIIGYLISDKLGISMGNKIMDIIDKLKDNVIFNLTKGDDNENKEIKQKNNRLLRTITINFLLLIFTSVFSVFLEKIVDKIFK